VRIKLLAAIILSSIVLTNSTNLLAQGKKKSVLKILGCAMSMPQGLRSAEYEGFLADDLEKSLLNEDGEPILSERQLQILSDEKDRLATFLLIRADILFFEKKGESPFAAKDSNKTNDGDVLLENHFILELLKQTVEANSTQSKSSPISASSPNQSFVQKEYYASVVLLAHELSHISQAKYGTSAKTGKDYELEADKRAGAILRIAHTPLNEPDVPKEKLKEHFKFNDELFQTGVNYLFELGDFELTDKKHHGMPIERMSAFLSGITSINDLLNQCYADSKELASLKNSKFTFSNNFRRSSLNRSLNTTVDKFLELGIDPVIIQAVTRGSCNLPTEKSRASAFLGKSE
jgi:hypothetical protein